jgi:hypothetical protein
LRAKADNEAYKLDDVVRFDCNGNFHALGNVFVADEDNSRQLL